MQPIHPMETRPSEKDPFADYNRGAGWGGLIAVLIVVALIIGAIGLITGGGADETPNPPAPTEAPIDPGF